MKAKDLFNRAYLNFMSEPFEKIFLANSLQYRTFSTCNIVELFPDGSFRVRWDEIVRDEIRAGIEPQGMVIPIALFSDREWNDGAPGHDAAHAVLSRMRGTYDLYCFMHDREEKMFDHLRRARKYLSDS